MPNFLTKIRLLQLVAPINHSMHGKRKFNGSFLFSFQQFYFAMMGGLLMEQQLLKINGRLLFGTGIDEILDHSDLSIIGVKTAVCYANYIKKARYALQVVVFCLFKKLNSAHNESGSSLSLHESAKKQSSAMFSYWYGILEFQINILMFVQSFRE